MFDKFKGLIEDETLFYGVLILLVGLASFGLGRWSAASDAPRIALISPIAPHATGTQASNVQQSSSINAASVSLSESSTSKTAKVYVASKNGTKYHLLTCPGAQQIKDENKIYFATKEEAEKAGYTPASNCKGL